MDYKYLAAVAAGALTLFVEASRRYRQTSSFEPTRRYVVLKDMEASDFSVGSDRWMGFTFYVGCYLVTYAIILSSVKLQSLLTEATAGQSQAGSNSQDQWSSVLFDTPNYGLPIFVSAGIISLLSLPMLDRIEPLIRGVAYFFAGIPGGFYRALEQLDVPLKAKLEERKKKKDDTTTKDMKLLTALRTAIEDLSEDAQDAVVQIELLRRYLTPESSAMYWPAESAKLRDAMIKSADDLYEKLVNDAKDIAPKGVAAEGVATETDAARTASLDEIADAAFVARDNFKAAFAILCILTSEMHAPKAQTKELLFSALRHPHESQRLRNLALWCAFWSAVTAAAIALAAAGLVWWARAPTKLSADVWFVANVQSAIYAAGRAACLIGAPALLAIAVQDSMRRLDSWLPWHGNLPPAAQYLRASVLPILMCAPLLVFWEVAFYVLKHLAGGTAEALTERNLATTVQLAYTQTILVLPIMVPLCFFVCIVTDLALGPLDTPARDEADKPAPGGSGSATQAQATSEEADKPTPALGGSGFATQAQATSAPNPPVPPKSSPGHGKDAASRPALSSSWFQIPLLISFVTVYAYLALYTGTSRSVRPIPYESFHLYIVKETMLIVGPLAVFAIAYARGAPRKP